MTTSPQRPSAMRYIYNHNPFYVVSSVLMLYAVRSAYGTLEIGAINTWMMMGALAGYTLLLAVIGILIVRWGEVWEDARSILLLLLLLFLGVSISADDLFVSTTPEKAKAILTSGFLFSVAISELVLRSLRIQMGLLFRIPYHLMLLLFYMAPWWCSPELHPRSPDTLEQILISFPLIAGLLFLCLIPAVRQCPFYVASNGTPWQWPWFPGVAFGVIAAAVCLRSFALCLTFGPTGRIWKYVSGGKIISFDTLWGPHFLIPFGFAILILLLESGIVSNNKSLKIKILWAAPWLILLSFPVSDGTVYQTFFHKLTQTIGTPFWLTVCLLIAFYCWAFIRGIPQATWGMFMCIGLLSFVDSNTTSLRTLIEPRLTPVLLAGSVLLGQGMWQRSSLKSAWGIFAATAALWIWLPNSPLAPFRINICFHLLWGASFCLSLFINDSFSINLRRFSIGLIPVVTYVVLFSEQASDISSMARYSYLMILSGVCLVMARYWFDKWLAVSCAFAFSIIIYSFIVLSYRNLADKFGQATMTAFAWSLGTLITAFLISAHKADWIKSRIMLPIFTPSSATESSSEETRTTSTSQEENSITQNQNSESVNEEEEK